MDYFKTFFVLVFENFFPIRCSIYKIQVIKTIPILCEVNRHGFQNVLINLEDLIAKWRQGVSKNYFCFSFHEIRVMSKGCGNYKTNHLDSFIRNYKRYWFNILDTLHENMNTKGHQNTTRVDLLSHLWLAASHEPE